MTVGHLTSATVLEPGAVYSDAAGDLRADAELALEIGDGETIAGYGAALELVNLRTEDAEAVVASNIFHRAVAFGVQVLVGPGDDVVAEISLLGRVGRAIA